MVNRKFASVDDYISSFPPDVQTILEEVRRTIRRAAPCAAESISYQIPTMTIDGEPLVYFAGWQHHLSIYPAPTGDDEFERRLAPYRSAKSTVKFPLREPIPYDLIERAVALHLEQH